VRPAHLNDRQRFAAQLRYEPVDRCPIVDFSYCDETLAAWRRQGLPPDADPARLFGLDAMWDECEPGPKVNLAPMFERRVIEDLGDRVRMQNEDGVIQIEFKGHESIPRFETHPIRDRTDWVEYRKRLDPETPERIPDDWTAICRRYAERDTPLLLFAGSLYGWPRNWMGVEGLSKTLYRDRTLFPEIVETIADVACTVLERALTQADAAGLRFDAAHFWEDMCFCQGPLISPKMVREYMLPHYRRITTVLARHGIDLVLLDCDGRIDALVDIWLEGGVNSLFPVEIGTWQADPVALRRRFGRELRMLGGFDKRILAAGIEAIDREIDRLAPLVEEGGFIPFCDHRVPRNVPLADYVHYVERAKAVWGRGTNVRPTWRSAGRQKRGGAESAEDAEKKVRE